VEEILFSKKEFQRRTSRTQELLIKNNLDALLITSDTNYYYYTGHRHHAPWSTFSRPLIVIIPQTGEPISLIHEFLFADASTSSWFSNIKYYSSLNEFPFEEIAKIIDNICLNNKRIGAELPG
jgi:Xaa-Pro aminopeptidase